MDRSGQLRLDGPQDCGVGDRAIVQRVTVDHRHRIEQVRVLDRLDRLEVLGPDLRLASVVIQDRHPVAISALDLGADYGRDLLRRPGRASTTGGACRLGRQVEYLDDDLGAAVAHDVSSTYSRTDITCMGHTRMHTPHPVQRSWSTIQPERPAESRVVSGTIAPRGQTLRAGQPGCRSHVDWSMIAVSMQLSPGLVASTHTLPQGV